MPKMTQSTHSSLHPTGNSVKSPEFDPPIPGAVEDNRSNNSLRTWEVIVEKVGLEGEIRQSEIAEQVGCSVRTVQRLLKDFSRCNLVEYESYNGRGKGIQLENLWLKKAEEIENGRLWKRGYEQEDKYMRTRYTRDGRLGTTSLDCVRNLGKTKTKDNDLGRCPENKNSQESSERHRRFQWLYEQEGSQKTSSREGFQKVIMWDLRTTLEGTSLSSDAVKPVCDRFWANVKNKTLRHARRALQSLKEKIDELVGTVEDKVKNGVRALYKAAEKFIRYTLMELILGYESKDRKTHETHEEDRKRRDEVRSRGASSFVSKIAPGIIETLGSDGSSDTSDAKFADQFLNEGRDDPATPEGGGDIEKLSKKQKRAVKRFKNYNLTKKKAAYREGVPVSEFENWIEAYEH